MTEIVQRRYVSYADAHYAGGLVDGAYVMRIFGEVATELSVVTEGDEGLLAGYEAVDFHEPVLAGDLLEVTGRITSVGRRSRRLELQAYVTSRSDHTERESGAVQLKEKLLVTSAVAVLVVPGEAQ
ncbi:MULTISPECIES: hotdog domain-containing protein [unclassified Mycolicibacterium]|uniref:hotdog domain-containing protein n=1 Tax=unclassified Mycolicibacterium TaxID=2636767 RepID=UPI0012DFB66B|nr:MULTISPECIES: hotdog domain-containing protein [unclassified Mycolicibacterium]MUL83746.1 3-aminobutyryl-CoA ammonia-lyase [Mycolicibacterium sp. CBMA 329]MUL90737.1 3-aminobutyryl-CoA ammonia-lyase [Mycolicibacterium sp. CBMA 331]MUM00705.1 3-aminobutyryl-CoA ammonia-lyase [Mycolicibacterium sp. CBMA 334]MUM30125.1 3-aminobutyryl-CoA ammonia-lyase [Mycolicibacterium sp. CBMA 295]MUM41681.1 3-aminobutyryl-CoA ammonia-lyase [Mycolicibacterium sp. CBMA 247]